MDSGGLVLPSSSKLCRKIRALVDGHKPEKEELRLYLEQGVYNAYLEVDADGSHSSPVVPTPLCPLGQRESEREEGQLPGGPRQPLAAGPGARGVARGAWSSGGWTRRRCG
eukprot:906362-Amphidinium_carterae.1